MRASSAFIRLFIRGLAKDADESGASLEDTLMIAARAKLTDASRGKVLTGSDSGGTSVTYSLPPIGTLTADDIAETCSHILDKIDAIKAATPDVTDEALRVLLLAEFPSVNRFQHDFSGFRQ